MIDIEMARLFIKKLTEFTDYNINIMDKQGIIIASKDPSRVGVYHEIAYDIIINDKTKIEVEADDEYLGVKNGVNLLLVYKDEKIGVLGITGNPDEVRPIAQVIKLSVEIMYELEIKRNAKLFRKNVKERFINNLLFDQDMDRQELEKDAATLGYEDNIIRVPVLITFNENENFKQIINCLKTSTQKYNPIVVEQIHRNRIVIFLRYDNAINEFFNIYKEIIEFELNELFQLIKNEKIPCCFYVGPLQRKFIYYRFSFQKCLWMEKNIDLKEHAKSDLSIFYFYDYIDIYMKLQLSTAELYNIFGALTYYFPEEFRETFISHIESLYKNNYNVNESSKSLFIHKNTFFFRLNKIRDFLGINPIKEIKDRYLAEYLYYYFTRLK